MPRLHLHLASTCQQSQAFPAAESACFQLWKMIVVWAFLAPGRIPALHHDLSRAEEPQSLFLVAYTCPGRMSSCSASCVLSGMEQA